MKSDPLRIWLDERDLERRERPADYDEYAKRKPKKAKRRKKGK